MTEGLWNKYDISRKSLEVPVKRSPKVSIIVVVLLVVNAASASSLTNNDEGGRWPCAM